MRTYKQLTQEQRYQIEILKKAGKDQKEIAKLLGVSPSTITRELKRNGGKQGYCPNRAQKQADKRRKQAAKALKMTEETILLIEEKIREDWSLELSFRLAKKRVWHNHQSRAYLSAYLDRQASWWHLVSAPSAKSQKA